MAGLMLLGMTGANRGGANRGRTWGVKSDGLKFLFFHDVFT
jgi:hypothetical protein